MPATHGPLPVRSSLLDAETVDSTVSHGFFTREGGISDGIYASLNVGLGSHDDSQNVLENRARVATWFNLRMDRLATVHQIHSSHVHVVTRANIAQHPQADGLVTREPGIAIGVLTADCGPILFADSSHGVIGAAHAGWRGAFAGIIENTIAAMEELGADRAAITACLGPSISQPNYEVGPEFVERALDADAANSRWFIPAERQGHFLFDLRSMSLARLERAGVKSEMIDTCTYSDKARFFSYRRTTHRNEADYGRQISAIAMREDANGPAF